MYNPLTILKGKRGASASMFIGMIIAIMVGFVLASALLPTAFEDLYAVDTTNWSTSAGNIWDLLPVICIVAILIAVVGLVALKGSSSIGMSFNPMIPFMRQVRYFKRLIKGKRGASASMFIGMIIAILIGIVLASALLPTAFEDIYAVNTTNWSTSAGNIWDLLPIIGIVALLVAIIGLIALRE